MLYFTILIFFAFLVFLSFLILVIQNSFKNKKKIQYNGKWDYISHSYREDRFTLTLITESGIVCIFSEHYDGWKCEKGNIEMRESLSYYLNRVKKEILERDRISRESSGFWEKISYYDH